MTTQLTLIETALQGLTMDVVINLTEHVQTLELKPNAELFTAYRTIDNTILIGYSEDLIKDQYSLNHRHFFYFRTTTWNKKRASIAFTYAQRNGN